MAVLKDILYTVALEQIWGSTNIEVSSIAFDSRSVEKDGLFVAIAGTSSNGHDFIDQAISLGAAAIICLQEPVKKMAGITYVKVKNSASALAIVSANFYDHPSQSMQVIGVTGTNGKSTIVNLLFDLFTKLGYKVGLISTIQYKIGEEVSPASHTTPDGLKVQQLMRKMVDAGCEYCFMEVSSHAVVQHRIDAINFKGGVFTNLSQDHLDYHETFPAYLEAKKNFFDQLNSAAFALSNIDDKRGKVMMQSTKAKKYSYSMKSASDYRVKVLEQSFEGLLLNIDNAEFYSFLVGEFNAYNLLAIYAVALLLNQDKMEVLQVMSSLKAAAGRFESINHKEVGVNAIVDYAHTPDALENVLKTIQQIRTRNEVLYTVVGCGGNRDKVKRPMMAKIACKWSDKVILTSDNPRFEDPNVILSEMKTGVEPQNFKKVLTIENRKEAIRTACMMANSGDIILVAGKGHEDYQEIKGERFPFDDKEIITETFNEINSSIN
ncbi:UNVERIFIED_CONTAM: hypothetical protein GTU68_044763 [Idotea baltica]|nr:hypothetical protein [Idotea baltica]